MVKSSDISYGTIGRSITMSFKISELSGRDKCNLFADLMNMLGITERVDDNFEKVWSEQARKHWED